MIGRRMKCEYTVVKTTLYLLVATLGTAKGEECYRAEFSEDVWSCPDFDNTVMKCDPLELAMVDEMGGEVGLNGMITMVDEFNEGTTVSVEVWKIIDIGKEYLYHAEGDLCSSIKDSNTAWFPLLDSMAINKCPIIAKDYPIKDMLVDLSHTKKMLTHEMCGDYLIQISMSKDLTKLSCYELGIAVSEYSCESKDE